MDKKIRVLVITHAPWRNDTSVGNSYSNIFNDMDDKIEFAQIYVRDGMPENRFVHEYFRISEKKLLKSVFNRRDVGEYFHLDNPMDTPKVVFSNSYNKMRSLRWDILLLGRDIASSLGKWKTKALDEFLISFNPDIIFGTLGFIPITNQLMVYAKEKTKAKLVPYPWDDWYHLNKQSRSIFYRVRLNLERKYIRKCVENSSFLYTITDQMKDEYTDIFDKKCKILKKGYDFSCMPPRKVLNADSISFVYTGNIGDRWEVLSKIGQAIAKINNKKNVNHKLIIYTLTPITNEMKDALNPENACDLRGAVPSSEVPGIMQDADVLVHVEPIDKVKLETCRLSFSTKIVDYLHQAKCILAVGGQNASMKYLKKEDAAIMTNELSELQSVIDRMTSNPEIITEYGRKAWDCGVRNHEIKNIQSMIMKDFESLL